MVLHAQEEFDRHEHTCYSLPMANTDYYLGRSTVTALLRDGLEGPALYSPEEPALSLSKGAWPGIGVSFCLAGLSFRLTRVTYLSRKPKLNETQCDKTRRIPRISGPTHGQARSPLRVEGRLREG